MVNYLKKPGRAVLGTVLIIGLMAWFGIFDRHRVGDDRIEPVLQDSTPDPRLAISPHEFGDVNRTGPGSDWPGLPPAPPEQEDTVLSLQPEPAEDERAPEMPLAELVEVFEDLEANQRGEVAYRIASGWMRCRGNRELDDAALRTEANRLVENRSRRLTEMAAHVLESGVGSDVAGEIENSIEEFAQQSREERVADTVRELREGQIFCSGIDNPGYDERNLRYVQWLERAADLGHPPARIAFAQMAFFWAETVSVGQAADLVERKGKVAIFLREAMARRNPQALEAMARVVGKGYYALPDQVLEYAYSLAAMRAFSGDAVGWDYGFSGEPQSNDLNMSLLRGRIERLEATLDPDDLRQAARLSERILHAGGP